MGLTYTNLELTNLFGKQTITVRALVDTGAMFMCVTEAMATQLGFVSSEMSTQWVTFADGRQMKVPRIAPIEIRFDKTRNYVTEALVLGNEALMGVLPLEAMDLMVNPVLQQVIVNPDHPNFPVALAK